MSKVNKKIKYLKKHIKKLQIDGNTIYNEQINCYGQIRGFKKSISILIQDELDGGNSRELNAIETNSYKMPR